VPSRFFLLEPTHVTSVQRSVLVDIPELGYAKGQLEIPAGATFELRVEILDVSRRA
jgi:hypothetical protein